MGYQFHLVWLENGKVFYVIVLDTQYHPVDLSVFHHFNAFISSGNEGVTTVTTVTTYTIPRQAVTVVLVMASQRPCCERSEPTEASACGCGFEGMGSEIPIKYASQVNCESNLFDVAYLALG